MSQTYILPVSGTKINTWRALINNSLEAVRSKFSGLDDPQAKAINYQWWVDENTSPPTLFMRNSANDAWIKILEIASNAIILPNGSVPMTGNLGMGGNLISNLADAIAASNPMPASQIAAKYASVFAFMDDGEEGINVNATDPSFGAAKVAYTALQCVVVFAGTFIQHDVTDRFGLNIRNITQGVDLLSADIDTFTAGLAQNVPITLAVNQNPSVAAGDVLSLEVNHLGSPNVTSGINARLDNTPVLP